ncbi:hypothetical protein PHYSODRAFT_294502 [Phytophthora sojae]|uniref:Uncharacterized protein n=1 Tax=Phytophthora sojae (strain P6497) TaxID=1094619 RepID=G4YMS9_PHYSP|nr:hypothetical protein PHYSODRAFT_294502 [Phytophthora sojae]EGZ29275.1 hypothetical protein PHYSODRAFT_294502 [Phytophthora sojae]|eukprot:XP_009516550.1 hypothetical protein PHYSODRAFT_294502 [Phytophthora sojae]
MEPLTTPASLLAAVELFSSLDFGEREQAAVASERRRASSRAAPQQYDAYQRARLRGSTSMPRSARHVDESYSPAPASRKASKRRRSQPRRDARDSRRAPLATLNTDASAHASRGRPQADCDRGCSGQPGRPPALRIERRGVGHSNANGAHVGLEAPSSSNRRRRRRAPRVTGLRRWPRGSTAFASLRSVSASARSPTRWAFSNLHCLTAPSSRGRVRSARLPRAEKRGRLKSRSACLPAAPA